jgi:hypothetical protein
MGVPVNWKGGAQACPVPLKSITFDRLPYHNFYEISIQGTKSSNWKKKNGKISCKKLN